MSHAFQFAINDKTYTIPLNYDFTEDIVAYSVCMPEEVCNALKAYGASLSPKIFKEDIKEIKGIRKMLKGEKNQFGASMIEFIIQLITEGRK